MGILKKLFFEITGGYIPRRKLQKQIIKGVMENDPDKYPLGSNRHNDLKYLSEIVAESVILWKTPPEYLHAILSDIVALNLKWVGGALNELAMECKREYSQIDMCGACDYYNAETGECDASSEEIQEINQGKNETK